MTGSVGYDDLCEIWRGRCGIGEDDSGHSLGFEAVKMSQISFCRQRRTDYSNIPDLPLRLSSRSTGIAGPYAKKRQLKTCWEPHRGRLR